MTTDDLTDCKVRWSNGRYLAWDFTSPDTLTVSHVSTVVTGPGAVANESFVDSEGQEKVQVRVPDTNLPCAAVAVEILQVRLERRQMNFCANLVGG
jgi:hypothetical protein